MNKNEIIETFNKHLMEFIMDVERVFPNDQDIKATRKSLSKTIMLVPKAIIRMFYDNFVLIYRNEIDKGDLTFFIDNDYVAKHETDLKDDVSLIDKINELREPVRNMTDADKANVVQYLKNLKQLAELYSIIRKGKN